MRACEQVLGSTYAQAPPYGPGSTSMSGLVDYSNVFVKVKFDPGVNNCLTCCKNLEPDVNSYCPLERRLKKGDAYEDIAITDPS